MTQVFQFASSRPPPKKLNRKRVQTQSSTSQPQSQISHKTKYAICFLCVFDGLRAPTMRRLIRKPKTICKKPLLTFDPSFYAPSSIDAIQAVYRRSIKCESSILVDPSVSSVLKVVKEKGSQNPTQRLLVHYLGQGCHPPSPDGSVFFFSDDRAKYKSINLVNLMSTCQCPLVFIFDCPCAAALTRQMKMKKDVFAFMACEQDENLPLSTEAPMDFFSSCLLLTYDTSIAWYLQQHSKMYDTNKTPIPENVDFLKGFLYAILDAIAFESQQLASYQMYTADEAIAQMFYGYILAQRVLLSFNVHTSAVPEIQTADYHPFWNIWDIAIDCSITLEKDDAISTLYNLFIESFRTISSPGFFSLFSYFINMPSIAKNALDELLHLLNNNSNLIEMAASSKLPNTLLHLNPQSVVSYKIIAKLLTATKENSFGFNLNPNALFEISKNQDIIKAGILSFCCAVIKSYTPNFTKLSKLCMDFMVEMAPMSSLFLGFLCERGVKLPSNQSFISKLEVLLNSSRDDIRASTVFLLGNLGDYSLLKLLHHLENEQHPIVKQQIVFALTKLSKINKDQKSKEMLEILSNDENESVRNSIARARIIKNQPKDLCELPNPIFLNLIKSVQCSEFDFLYENDILSSRKI